MNYGKIAPYYHALSTLVFGNTLIKSEQDAILSCTSGKCLIAGGGDGKALEGLELPEELSFDFVEISPEMIALAAARGAKNVRFLPQSIFDFRVSEPYQHILFPYLLDNFSENEVNVLLQKASSWLSPNAYLTIIDFTEKSNFWQKMLLKSMYAFFGKVADVPVKEIPPIERLAQENGFTCVEKFLYYGGFIERKVYKYTR